MDWTNRILVLAGIIDDKDKANPLFERGFAFFRGKVSVFTCTCEGKGGRSVPVVITLLIGLVGGFVFRKLHVTGAFMVGSALFVAVAQLLSFEASMPQLLRTMAQLISGTVIGLGIRVSCHNYDNGR